MTLYTNGTKDCLDLQKKLDENGIDYEVNTDIELMKDKGILSLPVVEKDGKTISYQDALAMLRGASRV